MRHLSRRRCGDVRMNSERQQLQPEERLTIASQHLQGLSIRTVSRMLGRLPATVSRELALINLPDGDARFPAGHSKQPDAPGFSRNHLRAEGNPSGGRCRHNGVANCAVAVARRRHGHGMRMPRTRGTDRRGQYSYTAARSRRRVATGSRGR
ncbi:helix-turn-helix domain-containing protein [Paraburkholderia phytofirmans]|uniref:helix-turn-helix domain-containing protein n=1 Tax=Paraburkholderia phytofirmans TaxID=261302 RepID=UPI0038BB7FFF